MDQYRREKAPDGVRRTHYFRNPSPTAIISKGLSVQKGYE